MARAMIRTPSPFLRRRRPGISLVEVLVVMAVLILGMLAILRLFPEGFRSLAFTGDATTAQRLMNLREEQLRNAREGLPDAIYPIDPANPLNILSTVQPNDFLGTLRRLDVGGTLIDDPRFSDVNVARRVFGEQFQIPPPATYPPDGSGLVSLYHARFAPIYSEAASPGGGGVAAYAGTSQERIIFNDPPRTDNFRALLKAGHFGYGVDYENGYLYLTSYSQPPEGRLFKVEYRFRAPSGGSLVSVQAPPDNTAYFPPGNGGQDPVYTGGSPASMTVQRFNMRTGAVDQLLNFDFTTEMYTTAPPPGGAPPPGFVWSNMPANGQVEIGSVYVYRRFKQLPLGQAFDPNNPFEFKVYDVTTGLFGFNPVAASFPTPTQQGRGIMAKIDYDVDDWHILVHEDAAPIQATDSDGVPDSGDEAYVIKLPAGPIKRLGDTEETLNFIPGGALTDNSFEYQNLIRYYPDTPGRATFPTRFDLIVVDARTGYQIDSSTLQRPGPTAPAGSSNLDGEIDYRSGTVRLWKYRGQSTGSGPVQWNSPFGTPGQVLQFDPGGRHLRVYYRAANDFAVASYRPFSRMHLQINPAALAYREYHANNPALPGGYVLFPNTDAEKTVAVDYTYLYAPLANPGQVQRRYVYGELHQIQPPGTAFAPAAAPGRWWIRLNHADSNGAPSDMSADPEVVPGSVEVLGVRGTSLHTRVAWLDGRRMRHRERATILTREATR